MTVFNNHSFYDVCMIPTTWKIANNLSDRSIIAEQNINIQLTKYRAIISPFLNCCCFHCRIRLVWILFEQTILLSPYSPASAYVHICTHLFSTAFSYFTGKCRKGPMCASYVYSLLARIGAYSVRCGLCLPM